jgi:hypothetical protein
MQRLLKLAAAIALVAVPAFAQTTTTVRTTDPPPPPPPSTSTTVTTQPQSGSSTTVTTGQQPPPSSSTNVVVNPSEPSTTTTTSTRVRASDEAVGISAHHDGRTDIMIVATDALYGGLAGTLIGGGIALINNGNNWGRDLMIGGGIGILAGAGFGIVEAATRTEERTTVRRAAADRNPGASSGSGLALAAGRF